MNKRIFRDNETGLDKRKKMYKQKISLLKEKIKDFKIFIFINIFIF